MPVGLHLLRHPTISLTQEPDTFGLANLFQVLESNIGIIGACLPTLRQPLRQAFPRVFGTAPIPSKPSRPYYDDRFTDEYVMQNFSNDKKNSGKRTWHDVSVTGPDLFKSSPRKSDEMHIIHDGTEFDNHSGGSLNETAGSQAYKQIRKDTSYSVRVAE